MTDEKKEPKQTKVKTKTKTDKNETDYLKDQLKKLQKRNKDLKSSKTEKRVVIQRPTIKYEAHQVFSGRSPKLEVTIKFSGDVELVGKKLLDDSYQEIFNMARNMVNKEMRELQTLLQLEKEKE